MSLQVIAERIEPSDQPERLRTIECELGQGFRFARPMDSSSFGRLLATPAEVQRGAVP